MEVRMQNPAAENLAAIETPKLSRSQRRTRQLSYLRRDLADLEQLTEMLLNLLEQATRPNVTANEKNRLRQIMQNVQDSLAANEVGEKRPRPAQEVGKARGSESDRR
jgi:hypothetical protein